MKILYIFTDGRRGRFNDILAGKEAPQELLFGAPYLADKGYDVDILEISDLVSDETRVQYKFMKTWNQAMSRVTTLTSCSHYFDEDIVRRFDEYDMVIAGNEYVAFGLNYWKKKAGFRSDVVFFVMGMLAKLYDLRKNPVRHMAAKYYYEQLIKESRRCILLGIGEYDYACDIFAGYSKRFNFLPFPVDTSFWTPAPAKREGEYILFMGNDARRDFELAVNIARRMKEYKFKFITRRLSQESVPSNIELICGDWKESILSDVEVRDIIRESLLVMLPIKETLQPSGQSVALQAMACGKAVIISKTKGFWDPDNFIDGKHLCFVKDNKIDIWCETVIRMLMHKGKLHDIGVAARNLVESGYNISKFGKSLEEIIIEINRKSGR